MCAIDVVVVAFNCADLVCECITSVFAYDNKRLSVNLFVVDNSSTDDVLERVKRLGYPVGTHQVGWNSGFGHASNVGASLGRAPWLLFLNPDARVSQDTLHALLEKHGSNSSIGMIGCRLVRADGTLDLAAKRTLPNPRSAFEYLVMHKKSGAEYLSPSVPSDGCGQVEAINGAFMLVRREAFEKVGGFDGRFWMYAEDLDLCKSIADAGWTIQYDGRVSATHLKSAVSGVHRSPRLNFGFHHSMALYYTKHFSGAPPAMRVFVLLGIWLRCAYRIPYDSLHRLRRGEAVAIARRILGRTQ